MHSYPHAPDEQVLVRLFETTRTLALSASAATSPSVAEERADRFWTSNARSLLDCARLAYALEEPAQLTLHYLRETAACFDYGLALGAPFHLDDRFDQLEVAIILGDLPRADVLRALPAARHAVKGVSFPAAVEREFDALVALSGAQWRSAGAALDVANAALADGKLPKLLNDDVASILALQGRILAQDAAGASQALAQRAVAFAAKFRSPAIASAPRGLLDLNGLAHAALARRTGLDVAVDSVYLPLALLQG